MRHILFGRGVTKVGSYFCGRVFAQQDVLCKKADMDSNPGELMWLNSRVVRKYTKKTKDPGLAPQHRTIFAVKCTKTEERRVFNFGLTVRGLS
jgi:hypothetical protein